MRIVIYILFIFIPIIGHGQLRNVLFKIDALELSIGPSIVTLRNQNITSENRQTKIEYTFRLGGVFNIDNKFSLITNLLYERKGLKTKYQTLYYDPSIDFNNCKCTTSLGTATSNSDIDYLTLSIPIRFHGHNNFFFDLGPYISYLINYSSETTQEWNTLTYYSRNNNLNKYDLGISLLFGYSYELSDKCLLNFTLADNLGLLNISDKTTTDTITKTNSFSFQIGLSYKLNREN